MSKKKQLPNRDGFRGHPVKNDQLSCRRQIMCWLTAAAADLDAVVMPMRVQMASSLNPSRANHHGLPLFLYLRQAHLDRKLSDESL